MKPHSHDVGVARAFDCFCKKVLRNEARDYQDALARKRNREVYFSELPVEVLEQFAVRDTYFTDSRTFEVIGHSVCIDDETLAEAISALPVDRRDVKSSFIATFQEYGLPNSVLSDNGSQFAGAHRGLSTFERFLIDLDILPIHGRPIHPQTQGKIERFHRTFKQEALRTISIDMDNAATRFANWRWTYNEVRPHHALGMKTPASVYQPSTRKYYKPKPYVYDEGSRLIKVNNWGYLRFGSNQLFLSETMADTYVEIRFTENDKFSVIYRNYIIASIDAVEGKLLERHIRRL